MHYAEASKTRNTSAKPYPFNIIYMAAVISSFLCKISWLSTARYSAKCTHELHTAFGEGSWRVSLHVHRLTYRSAIDTKNLSGTELFIRANLLMPMLCSVRNLTLLQRHYQKKQVYKAENTHYVVLPILLLFASFKKVPSATRHLVILPDEK